jgi:hypothetical protein
MAALSAARRSGIKMTDEAAPAGVDVKIVRLVEAANQKIGLDQPHAACGQPDAEILHQGTGDSSSFERGRHNKRAQVNNVLALRQSGQLANHLLRIVGDYQMKFLLF